MKTATGMARGITGYLPFVYLPLSVGEYVIGALLKAFPEGGLTF